MTDEKPGRRPAGSGVDGSYVETRKPTIDDQDDIDDQDGVLMDELDEESDLTLRVDDDLDGESEEEAEADTGLDRTDRAVNLEQDDREQ
jgi:hypothetical protein